MRGRGHNVRPVHLVRGVRQEKIISDYPENVSNDSSIHTFIVTRLNQERICNKHCKYAICIICISNCF